LVRRLRQPDVELKRGRRQVRLQRVDDVPDRLSDIGGRPLEIDDTAVDPGDVEQVVDGDWASSTARRSGRQRESITR
jgi:hypothetical protein